METPIKNKKLFNANKIKKYYKDQSSVRNLTKQFVDPLFPPNELSLMAKNNKGNWIGDESDIDTLDPNTIKWRSASEIFGDYYTLFQDKIECDDVKQGYIGDCYFIAAIASLTEFPDLIYNIFRTKEKSKYGYYEVCLFIEGEWQIVIVDDYFPVESNNVKKLKFTQPNGRELWVLLLEKAWAKVNGGYRNIIRGFENEALNALTSFPCERYYFREMSKEKIWKLIVNSDKKNNIMCVCTILDESIKEKGLVSRHAFTLIAAYEVKQYDKELQLVKIRNPWGYGEWNGNWSDKSELWTDDIKMQVNFKINDDGIFYMSFDDFIKYYDELSLCAIMPDCNVKTFNYTISKNNDAPIVYNINLRKDTDLGISAVDKNWRMTRELINKSNPLFIMLARYSRGKIEFIDGDYSENKSVDLIKSLKQGNYLLWVWNDFENSHNILDEDKRKHIKILLSSNDMFFVKIQAFDPEFQCLENIMYSGLVKHFNQSSNCFIKIENTFEKTGFGYLAFKNNSSDLIYNCTVNLSLIESLYPLPPYRNNLNNSFNILVYPGDYKIIIASRIKTNQSRQIWFNVDYSYQIECKDYMTNYVSSNDNFYSIYCNEEIKSCEVNNDFYDFTSSKFTNEQPKFKFDNFDNIDIIILREKYPKELELLDSLENIVFNQKLDWIFQEYESGSYIGQVNAKGERHGKGLYQWKADFGYYGYWEENKRSKFGIKYEGNYNKTSEGNYINDCMNGECTFYVQNDIIKCQVINDIKNGKGTYFWSGGSKWIGGFLNNQLHGNGVYYDAEGNSMPFSYEPGKPIN